MGFGVFGFRLCLQVHCRSVVASSGVSAAGPSSPGRPWENIREFRAGHWRAKGPCAQIAFTLRAHGPLGSWTLNPKP